MVHATRRLMPAFETSSGIARVFTYMVDPNGGGVPANTPAMHDGWGHQVRGTNLVRGGPCWGKGSAHSLSNAHHDLESTASLPCPGSA